MIETHSILQTQKGIAAGSCGCSQTRSGPAWRSGAKVWRQSLESGGLGLQGLEPRAWAPGAQSLEPGELGAWDRLWSPSLSLASKLAGSPQAVPRYAGYVLRCLSETEVCLRHCLCPNASTRVSKCLYPCLRSGSTPLSPSASAPGPCKSPSASSPVGHLLL